MPIAPRKRPLRVGLSFDVAWCFIIIALYAPYVETSLKSGVHEVFRLLCAAIQHSSGLIGQLRLAV